jgi:cation diffusion facilitator CzcD-associated flavoprotein CzcO
LILLQYEKDTDSPSEILHSRWYKNGIPYKGKRCLVVGSGNSGAEIALDLVEHGASAVDMIVRRLVILQNQLLY